MRLTLRIILSYLNQVLGPEDMLTIETQIAQDPSTSQLIRRIREALRHTSLQAEYNDIPTLDPNLVAEYLDNELSAEEVLDFEKICLESDGNLAEVASCYHTLTEVLSGAAPPEPLLRQRLGNLADSSQNTHEKNVETHHPKKKQTETSDREQETSPCGTPSVSETSSVLLASIGDTNQTPTVNPGVTNMETRKNDEQETPTPTSPDTHTEQSGGMLLHGIPLPPPVPRRNLRMPASSTLNESQVNATETQERSTEDDSTKTTLGSGTDESRSNERLGAEENDNVVENVAVKNDVVNDIPQNDVVNSTEDPIAQSTETTPPTTTLDSSSQSSDSMDPDVSADTAESVEIAVADHSSELTQTTGTATNNDAKSTEVPSDIPFDLRKSSTKSTKSAKSATPHRDFAPVREATNQSQVEPVWGDPDDERMSLLSKVLLSLLALTMVILAGAGGLVWYQHGGFQSLASADKEKSEPKHNDFVSETAGLQDKEIEEGYAEGRVAEQKHQKEAPTQSRSTDYSPSSSDTTTNSDDFDTMETSTEPSTETPNEGGSFPVEQGANSIETSPETTSVEGGNDPLENATNDQTNATKATEGIGIGDPELPDLEETVGEPVGEPVPTELKEDHWRTPRVPNLLIKPQLAETFEPEQEPEPEPIVIAEPEPDPDPIAFLQTPLAVVIRIRVPQNGWYEGEMVRLSTQTPIFPGDRLVNLPTYRSEVKIGEIISIESVGETALRLPDYHGPATVPFTLERGRFIIKTSSETGLDLQCVLGDQPGSLHLENSQTIVALEITRNIPGQQDPEKTVGGFSVQISCTEGSARWTPVGTPEGMEVTPIEIARLRQLLISYDPMDLQKIQREVLAMDEVPAWIEMMPITPLETNARDAIEEKLRPDNKGITSKLNTIARDDTRRETRELARRAMRAIEQYDVEIYLLYSQNDNDQWDSCLAALESDIQRSKYAASKIRNLLERRFAAAGNDIYQLLWKYHGLKEPPKDSLKEIIAMMKHNKPVVRSAAFRALMLLYPGDARGYSPERVEASRNASIKRWERFLKLESTITDKATTGEGSIGRNGQKQKQGQEQKEKEEE